MDICGPSDAMKKIADRMIMIIIIYQLSSVLIILHISFIILTEEVMEHNHRVRLTFVS